MRSLIISDMSIYCIDYPTRMVVTSRNSRFEKTSNCPNGQAFNPDLKPKKLNLSKRRASAEIECFI